MGNYFNNGNNKEEKVMFFNPLGNQEWRILDLNFLIRKTLPNDIRELKLLYLRFNVNYSIEEIKEQILQGKNVFNISASFLEDVSSFQYHYEIEIEEIEDTYLNRLHYPTFFKLNAIKN
ncbi:hypothetical protein JST56_07735 [Candidatus Dependentiae bacterium]|nr:hypothetical protein [Candidatus Dependentiae bacterium]